jgi:peptide/nickel transport system substrate-binding protein
MFRNGDERAAGRGISRRSLMARAVAMTVFPALLSLSGRARAQSAPLGGKPLIIAMKTGSLRTLDPNNAYEAEWFIFGKALYSQLVTLRGSTLDQVVGDFASTWDVSSDGLTYVFNLNPKAKFSDGSAATADDLVFSFNRFIRLKGPGSWLLDGVKSVEKSGDNQVKITLTEINVDFLQILTTPSLNIGQAKAIKANGGTDAENASESDTARSWLDDHSVGSGPFVLERWTRGSELVLKRNPNFWGTPSPVETVICKFVDDPNIQRSMLLAGDAHIAVNLSPDIAADLGSESTVQVHQIPALAPAYFGWSADKNPALRDPKIWDALKYAIDYEGLAQIYLGGGQKTGSIVPPSLGGALPADQAMKEDLERAKAALAAGGHPDGFTMNASFASDGSYTTVPAPIVAQKVAADLSRIGITVNLNPMLFAQMLTDYRGGNQEAIFHWWSSDYVGWTDYLPLFAAGGPVAKKRHQWDASASPEAQKIADLVGKAKQTLALDAQYALTKEAQSLINQHGPYAFLFETNYQLGVRSDAIASLPLNPVWYFDHAGIEFT